MPELIDRQDFLAWRALHAVSTREASAQTVEVFLGGLGNLVETVLRLIWD